MAAVAPSPNSNPQSGRRRRLSNFHILGGTPQKRKPSLSTSSTPACTPSKTLTPTTPSRALSRTPSRIPPRTSARTPFRTPRPPLHRSSVVRPSGRYTPRDSANRSRLPALSRQEIAHMYSETIKLCQDNKINARNTWTLNLIDYMSMLVKNDTNEDQLPRTVLFEDDVGNTPPTGTNFQLAGVTLDAGVKIYCSRVDSVHTNAFKVLGGLSRSGNEDGSNNLEENSESTDNGRRQRRNGRKAGTVTLETNLKNITSLKLETDLAVDPLFQKMSAAFDEGGASSMLMNNLPIGPNAQVIFDSGEVADHLVRMGDENDALEEALYDISKWLPQQPITENDTICAPFLRYFKSKQSAITVRRLSSASGEPLDEARTSTSNTLLNDGSELAEHSFGYDDNDLQDNSDMGVLPPPEVPFDMASPADCDDVTLDVSGANQTRNSVGPGLANVVAIGRGSVDLVEAGVTMLDHSDYSYFDTNALVGWAGPRHWTFRVMSTAKPDSEAGSKKRGGRKPKDKNAMLLDFSSEAPPIDFAEKFAPAKRESLIQMSTAVRNGFSKKKITLPEDHHLSIQSLYALFLKPKMFVKGGGKLYGRVGEEPDSGDSQNWYDFDNPGDTENYCPAEFKGLDDYAEGGQDQMDFDGDGEVGVELIAEPTRVEKIDINYAKVAKRVDVRQLKVGIWTKLCGGSESEGKRAGMKDREDGEQNVENCSHETSCGLPDVRDGGVQNLQSIVSSIPSIVPASSVSDVSVPYVFICLLHLANEKQLKITQGEGQSLKDLIVRAESDGQVDAVC
ncbi:Condensin complex subunit 2 [Gracilariopsis chorda]|uniref:Condensin complex subunit 2 n=1 Tax=Gracilariopsis chorda TaxID=448386 RepID=A0A2V3J8C9_9FLOR|nr:Condensin complex subunit 2 [Gracilariopsis chorda]|eukprot:PXF50142.1 Condensin complex subunit 2 [Gracilariopsis chorda]